VYSDILKCFGGNGINGYFEVMLPVGISFYAFQTASYVIDCYKGKIKAEKHFGYYALFVIFFPQLVAGPIERPEDLLPQLKLSSGGDLSISKIDYSSAFRIMLIGFFKKIAIDDVLGIYVNNIYQDISSANGLMVLIASLLFAVQIYCDFSGYSDIAVGCAKLFGVNLTENFNNPYSAKSIKEFWNRWHISLSKWLRDYIYFPLGGSKVKKCRWIINIIIVFLVSGLWHGANYTFIVWGLLHGIFQVIGVLNLKYRDNFWKKMKVNPEGKIITFFRIVGTFLLVDFCWIFFRANNISDACIAVSKIFIDWKMNAEFFKNSFVNLGINWKAVIYIVVCIASLFVVEKLKYVSIQPSKIFNKFSIRYVSYFVMSMLVICAWIYLQASDVGSSFIYFQF
jgi:D-alanyl-lipoteichoic acid acyltransferase DltB (MBOAT superfamily)